MKVVYWGSSIRYSFPPIVAEIRFVGAGNRFAALETLSGMRFAAPDTRLPAVESRFVEVETPVAGTWAAAGNIQSIGIAVAASRFRQLH